MYTQLLKAVGFFAMMLGLAHENEPAVALGLTAFWVAAIIQGITITEIKEELLILKGRLDHKPMSTKKKSGG